MTQASRKVKKGLRKPLSVIHLQRWAHSALGQEISLTHSPTATSAGARPVVLIGGVHGDEPEGVQLATAALDWLTQDAELLNPKAQVPWIVIPCLNPDGYKANKRVNGHGVDLNRNYPSKDWAPDYKEERYHPGSGPGSEPEVQAMVKLIEQTQPRLIIHCHSWHPCIVFTGEPARKDAEALAQSSGYSAVESIGYPTPGSLSQYGWHDNGIPIICIEEAERVPEPDIWPRFVSGFENVFGDPSPRT